MAIRLRLSTEQTRAGAERGRLACNPVVQLHQDGANLLGKGLCVGHLPIAAISTLHSGLVRSSRHHSLPTVPKS